MQDRYGSDVLAGRGRPRAIPELAAEPDVVVEDAHSGFCGAIVSCTSSAVTLEDRHGTRRTFPLTIGAFLVDGGPVTLVLPTTSRSSGPRLSASGSVLVQSHRARTARAARIWVEGIHDATLIERVWGHDLRVEGIVVEPLDGLDNLPTALAAFGPGSGRRVGVLADHLIPNSKESRIAAAAAAGAEGHLLVTGHPYVDIWQAIRPGVVGIRAWPPVPRGVDWKTGVCAALGVADPTTMWRRINGAVRTHRDLETPLITAVERLIDFVAQADR